jgi:lipopolysaccharide transport system permease protein
MNPFVQNKISLTEMMTGVINHRHLIQQLVRRDIQGRYRESMLGLIWALLNPLIMLAVYTFVFSVVFKARWHMEASSGGRGEFALVLFIGLIIHGLLAECVNRAPSLIISLQHRTHKESWWVSSRF